MPSLNTGNSILSNAIKVDSSYRVGIGTASPAASLHIAGAITSAPAANGVLMGVESNYAVIHLNGTSGTGSLIDFSTSGTDYKGRIEYDNTNNWMRFGTDGAERMRITSGGNVGIGTNNPSYRFDVQNGSDFDIRLRDSSLGGTVGILFETANDFSGTSQAYIKGIGSAGAGTSQLIFGTAGASGDTTATERMRITAAGNVGIGTSSPAAKAEVRGNGNIAVNSQGNFFVSSGGTAAQAAEAGGQISFGAWLNGDLSVPYPVAAIRGVSESATTDTNKGALIFATMNNTTTAERMRIASNGDLLVGQTSANGGAPGVYLRPTLPSGMVVSNNVSLELVRLNSNGPILVFYYGGTQVGSISTNSNSLPSDLNFKKDIFDISLGLNLVTKLRPVHYRHKIDELNEPLSNGIIAQELEQSLLECGVEKNSLLMLQHKPNEKEGESQYWVDYTKMIPVLIKAIQEQQAQIEAQQQTINSLINR
jgi:hypothetical protein